MFLKKLLTAMFTLLWTHASIAGGELEPEDSPYSGISMPVYTGMVLTVLQDALAPNVLARAIVLPSFQAEYAVGIKREGDNFFAFHLQPQTRVWDYKLVEFLERGQMQSYRDDGQDGYVLNRNEAARLKATSPDRFQDIKVVSKQIELNPLLARRLVQVWQEMLLRTRYQKTGRAWLDGDTYHFAAKSDTRILAGKVHHTPDNGPNVELLVRIADTLKALCLTNDPKRAANLEEQARTLHENLKN